ncbi:hypothetical protein ACFFJX_02600 [Pseudarcicella hirudinis]|uniref:hypothetical protein n=1 Tax=Pseudarcicella hirudinis TaxID=1079859 RepID=UPI0035EBC5D8
MTMLTCESNIDKISQTFEKVRSLSYNEKRNFISTEESINTLLDTINELKQSVNSKKQTIDSFVGILEQITWLNDLDETCLIKINEIISLSRDFHATLIRYYNSLAENLIAKGIARREIQISNCLLMT